MKSVLRIKLDDLNLHTYIKDEDQSNTGRIGIRIRCILHKWDNPLTIMPQELERFGVPDLEFEERA